MYLWVPASGNEYLVSEAGEILKIVKCISKRYLSNIGVKVDIFVHQEYSHVQKLTDPSDILKEMLC